MEWIVVVQQAGIDVSYQHGKYRGKKLKKVEQKRKDSCCRGAVTGRGETTSARPEKSPECSVLTQQPAQLPGTDVTGGPCPTGNSVCTGKVCLSHK